MAVIVSGVPISTRLDLSFSLSRISPYFTFDNRHALPSRPPFLVQVDTTFGPVTLSIHAGVLQEISSRVGDSTTQMVLGRDWLTLFKQQLKEKYNVDITTSNVHAYVPGLKRVDGSVFFFGSSVVGDPLGSTSAVIRGSMGCKSPTSCLPVGSVQTNTAGGVISEQLRFSERPAVLPEAISVNSSSYQEDSPRTSLRCSRSVSICGAEQSSCEVVNHDGNIDGGRQHLGLTVTSASHDLTLGSPEHSVHVTPSDAGFSTAAVDVSCDARHRLSQYTASCDSSSVNVSTHRRAAATTPLSSSRVSSTNMRSSELNISEDGVLILDQRSYLSNPVFSGDSVASNISVPAAGLVLDPNPGPSTLGFTSTNDTVYKNDKLITCLCDRRSTTYAFTSNLRHLQLNLQSHGLPVFTDDLEECRRSLLFHVFSGGCVRGSRMDGPVSPSACFAVGDRYCSGIEQAYNAVCVLFRKESEELHSLRLCLSAALGLSLEGDFWEVLDEYRRGLLLKSPKCNDIYNSVAKLYELTGPALVALAASHGLPVRFNPHHATLVTQITTHLVTGQCVNSITGSLGHLPVACGHATAVAEEEERLRDITDVEMQASVILMMARRLSQRGMSKLCGHLQIILPKNPKPSSRMLRNFLRQYATGLQKSKNTRPLHSFSYRPSPVGSPPSLWPPLVTPSFKDKLLTNFDVLVSDLCRGEFTCCACAGSYHVSERNITSQKDIDLGPLLRPDKVESHCIEAEAELTPDENEGVGDVVVNEPWLPLGYSIPRSSVSHVSGFEDILIDSAGVELDTRGGDNHQLSFCKGCYRAVQKGKTPALSLANKLYVGPVPAELRDLTLVEQNMIARCRTKAFIIRLQEADSFSGSKVGNENSEEGRRVSDRQRAMRGHVIVYPQEPSATLNVLPPSLDDLAKPIAIVFIGSNPPTNEWLEDKAKFLAIRPQKVRAALLWLIEHNPLYRNVRVNYSVLNDLPAESLLPVHIEHVVSRPSVDPLTSTYDPVRLSVPQGLVLPEGHNLNLERLVVADVDVNMPENVLHSAAVNHVKDKKGYLQVPHEASYVNEFDNPDLFPMMYPSLFPYGLGGLSDRSRPVQLTMRRHLKHLFNLSDQRFQRHSSFLFSAFNMLQRHEMLYRTSMKVKRARFADHARSFVDVDPATIKRVAARYAAGDTSTSYDEKEEKVMKLMKEVKVITSRVQGSSSSRVFTRNEIRAVITERGLPSFYITVNPADVHNPILRVVAGERMSMDDLCSRNFLSGWSPHKEVSENPFTGARFFKFLMEAFIKTILGYDPNIESEGGGGVLGKVKSYYGCVEAQGRGSLHCHMLVWLDGAFNPDELKAKLSNDETFRDRVIAYLDDTIHTAVPLPFDDSPVNVLSSHVDPCTVYRERRCIGDSDNAYRRKQRADLRNTVYRCQFHGEHHPTCFKHCRPGEPKVCRFGMDQANFVRDTTFDLTSGQLTMRCLDGLINNYNPTMTEALRCNTDIKFIGSGASAKAILYYVTNYITKTQLKAHVAFSAVEAAISRMGKVVDDSDGATIQNNAKRLLNACARAVLYHQELSAQQVASYLLDIGDKFVSDKFRALYWPSFERYIEQAEHNTEIDTSNDMETDLDVGDISGDEESDDVVVTDMDDEEIRIASGRKDDGSLKAEASQLSDYLHRPSIFRRLSLWDYVAQVDKIGVKRRNRPDTNVIENDAMDEGSDSDHDYATALHVDFADDGLLGSVERERPQGFFRDQHLQCGTHKAVLRKPTQRYIPMTLGPAIPRRDREESKERHARLMLILFKPWRTLGDLKSESTGWQTAYQRWSNRAIPRVTRVIDNMQLLHECKDSRDAHFESRKRAWGNSAKAIQALQSRGLDVVMDDSFTGEADETELAVHLERVERLWTDKKKAEENEVLQVQYYGERAGMFSIDDSSVLDIADSIDRSELVDSDEMERRWDSEYQTRKKNWQQSWISEGQTSVNNRDSSFASMPSLRTDMAPPLFVIPSDDSALDLEGFQQIDVIIEKYRLNVEQARAFKIIAQHSLDPQSQQLRMFLGGPGGTGKSTVINALTEFFEMRGQGRRLRLSSFTGVAARNIGGVTLHAALNLWKSVGKKRAGTSSAAREQLRSVWKGVDYLVVDEVSMIGCRLMSDISEVLCVATGINKPFGGVNVVFAGDFAQLPPVAEWKLYKDIPADAHSSADQKNAFGRLLWLSVDTVVMLTQVMRTKDARLTQLLSRLRYGRCNDSDYNLLSSRLACNLSSWRYDQENTPIIVSHNGVKDALNVRAAKSFAASTGRSLHWYYSTDRLNGAPIQKQSNQEKLEKKCSSETAQLLAKIPMVIGMPVIFTSNFDVQSGVVNGAVGKLTRIRYRLDERGRRHATSCVVKLDHPKMNSEVEPLSTLQWDEVVATEQTYSFKSKDHYDQAELDGLSRTQLPIQPAFAITCHKSQGKTMDKVVVDLQSCRGAESPYVMISRATSLDGLVLLRPFQKKKIQCRPSEERRKEFLRLDVLCLRSIFRYGNAKEREEALNELSRYGASYVDKILVMSREIPFGHTTDKSKARSLLNVAQDATASLHRHVTGATSVPGTSGTRVRSKRKAVGTDRTSRKKPRIGSKDVTASCSRD